MMEEEPTRVQMVAEEGAQVIEGIRLAESLEAPVDGAIEPVKRRGGPDRDPTTGRFLKGTRVGRTGCPDKRTLWRNEFEAAIKPGDVEKAVLVLIQAAHGGKPWAARELFDRMWGRPQQSMDVQIDAAVSFAGVLARLCEVAGDD